MANVNGNSNKSNNISLASIISRPQSTGFYVDLSNASTEDSATNDVASATTAVSKTSSSHPPTITGPDNSNGGTSDRNHLFSMFIDFAEPSIHPPKRPSETFVSGATVRSRSGQPDHNIDDTTDVVTLRRHNQHNNHHHHHHRAAPPDSPSTTGTGGNSSTNSRQSWTLQTDQTTTVADDLVTCFPFDDNGSNGHRTTMTLPQHHHQNHTNEDSCSASVVSADHGYQSMPLQLITKNSRSRNSVLSLGSTTSMGSSHEDVRHNGTNGGAGAGAVLSSVAGAPLPPLRKYRHRSSSATAAGSDDWNTNQTTKEVKRPKDEMDETLFGHRESSFSDAEEAAGVRADRRSNSSCHSSYDDLAERTVASCQQQQPQLQLQSAYASHPLRKNNSLSHVGEQMLLLRDLQNNGHTMETLQATMERQQKLLLLETVNEETPMSSFVKLSDMDRQPEKETISEDGTISSTVRNEPKMSRSGGSGSGSRNADQQRSQRGSIMSRSMGTNLSNLASTEDTLRSLSRLFPHLSQELAFSPTADCGPQQQQPAAAAAPIVHHLTNGLPVTGRAPTTRSSADGIVGGHNAEYMFSDLSAASSATSSFSRSGIDSADEWSLSSRQPRRLGEDLLKMFLQEIATDVTLDVAGRPIRAHQCILRSRCQYFAAMLAGEQQHPRIQLAGYSFGSVHFALCHIYSGAAHPPQGISLFELAALSDMLSLEGLKEVTTHALRSHYCHNFHKPCTGCIEGIMRVFPVTLQHGLDDLYHKCLRWTCKHYVTVWSTRAFALLPADLIERCVQYVVAHINSETVLTLLLNCDNLVTMLSSCRWAIGVENTVRDLIDTARNYVADHFANLLASDWFLSLGQDQCDNIARLENLLLRTASTLTPEQACRSYQRATRLNGALRAKVKKPNSSSESSSQSSSQEGELEEDATWNGEFLRFVEAILLAVEHCLTRQCARAMRTQQWQRMELELRKRIQGLACLTDSMESKRSSKNNATETTGGWTNGHHRQITDMHEVKMAIESLSKRSKEGRYPNHAAGGGQRVDRNAKADANLDKVTKLRKPTAVSQLSNGPRPHTIHTIGRTATVERLSTAPARTGTADAARPHFKHSISVDAAVTHRPPPPPQQVRHPSAPAPPVRSASTAARFAEIRPRYLEPKARIAAQSVDNLTAAGASNARNIHSSSNSCKRDRPTGASMKSINSLGLSRDSLATNSTATAHCRPAQYRSQTITSQDSLNSRRPATRSMSRDSLAKSNSMTRLRRPFSGACTEEFNNTNTSNTSTATTTTRSSRLSTGYLNSPRDTNAAAGHLAAARKAAAAGDMPQRKSFLSAKSREILAKRSAALNRTESMSSTGPNNLRCSGLNKSSSTSSIPSVRKSSAFVAPPTPMQTTLHLRRSARLPSAGGQNKAVSAAALHPSVATPSQRSSWGTASRPSTGVMRSNDGLAKKAAQTATNMLIKNDMERREKSATAKAKAVAETKTTADRDDKWSETRMERSLTFCKESSNLDASVLTIVE